MGKTLSQMINDFQKRRQILKKSVADSLNETSKQWIALNDAQMTAGLTSENKKIGKYRSKEYADYKFQLNPFAGKGNVDLRLTGAFYRAKYVIIQGNKLISGSKDPKNDDLEDAYGEKIHGLNPANMKRYIFFPYWSVLRQKLDL